MGRDEHNRRQRIRAQVLDYFEAIQLGHSHVQKNQIRRCFANIMDRVDPIVALGDQLDVGFRLQELTQALPCQRLVIRDEDS